MEAVKTAGPREMSCAYIATGNDGPATVASRHGRHEDDSAGTFWAVLARTWFIRKAIMLPKLKAAAWFQPEDHVSSHQVKVQRRLVGKSWGMRVVGGVGMKAIHYGGIFGSGMLLFVGHDIALARLSGLGVDELEKAPPLQSAAAGAFGGALYSLTATPIANFLRNDAAIGRRASLFTLAQGMHWTLLRDVGGFGLYFGAYTAARDACLRAGLDSAASAHSIAHGEGHALTLAECARRTACASLSGGFAACFAYSWRSPLDTLYKINIGARAADTPLLSRDRFLSSPRGLRAITVGALTWGVYEMTMLAVAQLHRLGLEMESLDQLAFVTWYAAPAYTRESGHGHRGRVHSHPGASRIFIPTSYTHPYPSIHPFIHSSAVGGGRAVAAADVRHAAWLRRGNWPAD